MEGGDAGVQRRRASIALSSSFSLAAINALHAPSCMAKSKAVKGFEERGLVTSMQMLDELMRSIEESRVG
eukprot:930446-Pelagomonas_calceolata.AAC.3